MKNNLKTAVIVVAILFAIGWISSAVTSSSTNSEDVKGFVLTLEAFNAGCKQGAMEEGTVTDEQATTYCTCVYNKGVDQYGGEEWTNQLETLDETNTFTADMNVITNSCIQSTLSTETI